MYSFKINHITISHCLLVLAFIIAGIGPSAVAFQTPVECEVLQYKLDRLYFSCGTESGIYPKCRFIVRHNADTVYTGCIEASYPGISYSYVTNSFFDSLNVASYTIQLIPASIDSVAPVVLGDIETRCFKVSENDSTATRKSRISILPYESSFEMKLDFETGKLDGFFSFSRYAPLVDSINTVATPAPYYIALVPNPSRTINTSGFLTASLYYRFDASLMTMVFPGDNVVPFNCLTFHAEPCERPYPYNPKYGKKLLRHIFRRPKRISIGMNHWALEPVAKYFADILSRDYIRTTIQSDTKDADLYLLIVPLAPNDKLVSLQYLQNFLTADTTAGNPINEALTIIQDYLHTAENTPDPDIQAHYCRLAELSFRDDVGVYPLFRPTVFFTHYRTVMDVLPDSTGMFDLDQLMKFHIADTLAECGK